MQPSTMTALLQEERWAETLRTPLRLAGDLVLLKLFLPPRYYGSYLAFGADSEPIGVLDEGGLEILRLARGVPVADLLAADAGPASISRLDAVLSLVEAGLLVPGDDQPAQIHVIAPDQAGGTRHRGPGADAFIRYFYDYFGGVFFEGSPAIDTHGDFLPVLKAYFPEQRGVTCLDAGTGSGYHAAALARLGNHVYACDISKTRLEAAAKQPCAPGTITPVECNLEKIPLPDASIDFAMCNFVLEHVADPFALIDELIRLVRPGGTILLAVPSFSVRETLAVWLRGEVPSLNFEHLRSYGLIPRTHPWCEPTLDTLRYLEERGVSIERVQGVNITQGLWEPWASAVGAVAAQLGDAFSITWPWNCLGEQTVIQGRRTS